MKTVVTISSSGQISIPAAVRKRWGRTRLVLDDQGDRLVLEPLPEDPIGAAIGSLAGPGPSSAELRSALSEGRAGFGGPPSAATRWVTDPILASRLAGGVWGHLIGDAIGVPYEFRTPSSIGRVHFGARGAHRQPAGTWSDDGALILATLDSLLSSGFDIDDQGRRFLDWADRGAYTPDGDGPFDIGGTTSAALAQLRDGVHAINSGGRDERDNGNGALMRILPVALSAAIRRATNSFSTRKSRRGSRTRIAGRRRLRPLRRHRGGAARRCRTWRRARGLPPTASAGLGGQPAEARVGGCVGTDPVARRARGRGFVIDSFWSAWEAFAGARHTRRRSRGPFATATTRTPRRPSPAASGASSGASTQSRPTGWPGCVATRPLIRWWTP